MILRDWWVTTISNGFTAPECAEHVLKGTVFGHPRKADCTKVITSPIRSVAGRLVTTASGSIYELEAPHPDYLEWLAAHQYPFDPDEPIRSVRKLANLPKDRREPW